MTSDMIYLSPPDVGPRERELLLAAFDSNWIAPLGPEVDRFERAFAEELGVEDAAALSSGTAALHLALQLVGVEAGDEVLVSDFTFVATANAVAYLGARPVFIDSDATWTMDPDLLDEELERANRHDRLPKAVIAVDLYGQCANYDRIVQSCARFEIPVIEDAAEALGARYDSRPAGTLGRVGVFSFNGNKIITTSGGGMLVAHDAEVVARARWLASQAREPVLHYEHTAVGFNYRMSNLLAALGRAQLETLGRKVARRREINRAYRAAFADLPGVSFMPEAPYGQATFWLTCLLLDDAAPVMSGRLCQRLNEQGIEARPVWKPMHLQPLYRGARVVGGACSEDLFARGVCLPSGSGLTDEQFARVVGCFRREYERA